MFIWGRGHSILSISSLLLPAEVPVFARHLDERVFSGPYIHRAAVDRGGPAKVSESHWCGFSKSSYIVSQIAVAYHNIRGEWIRIAKYHQTWR